MRFNGRQFLVSQDCTDLQAICLYYTILFKVNSLGSSLKLFGIDLIPNAETQKMNFVLSVLVCGDVGCFLNFPHSPAIVAIVK